MPIPILSLAGAPRCPVPLLHPVCAGEQRQGCRIPQPSGLGVSAEVRENLACGWGQGDIPVIFCPLGEKLCCWDLCVCLHAAVAIAWPLALIILMAFHTPGKSLRTLLLGMGCCWLGNWDTAPGNLTGSLHKMKLSSGWDFKKKRGRGWGEKSKFRFNSIVNFSRSVITNRKFKAFNVKVLELTESLRKRLNNYFCPDSYCSFSDFAPNYFHDNH